MRKFVDRLEGNKNMILGGMEHLDSWHEAQKGEESLIPPGMREPKPPSGEADEVRQHSNTDASPASCFWVADGSGWCGGGAGDRGCGGRDCGGEGAHGQARSARISHSLSRTVIC